MAVPTTLQIIQLTLMGVSIPVYLWFLLTILINRKKHPFNSSFFKLCISMGFCDLQCLLTNLFLKKFKALGWLGMDILARSFNSGVARLFMIVSVHGTHQQFVAITAMAFNRCTALAYFNKHELIWTPKFTTGVILFQFFFPLATLTPALFLEDFYFPVDNVTGEVGACSWKDSALKPVYMAWGFIFLWLAIISTLIIYGITVFKTSDNFAQVAPVDNLNPNHQHENHNHTIEVRLTMIGLILTLLLAIEGYIVYKLATIGHDPSEWHFYSEAWTTVNDAVSWCNPWLCLFMSTVTRQHMIALITGQTIQLAPSNP